MPKSSLCPYPGCLYLTNSEDDLQNHYSCHFGPMLPSPTDPAERLVDNPPDAELLHIEHIIRDLDNQSCPPYESLVIDASLSLIRRLYQAARDGLSTNEGDLLLAPYHPSEDQCRMAKASVWLFSLSYRRVGITIDFDDYRSQPRKRSLECRLVDGATAAALGDSRWAWLLFVTDLQSSSCTCVSCVTKDIKPAVHSGPLVSPTSDIRLSYFASGLYRCDSHGCSHKSKRWADLQRHVSSSHCSKPASYPCSFPGCQRGGGNGFPRKDKLKSHFENVHRGRGIPPSQPRALAPK